MMTKNRNSRGLAEKGDDESLQTKSCKLVSQKLLSLNPPKKRIPIGFNFVIEEDWPPKLRQHPKRRSSGDSNEVELCYTVPAKYYSRHHVSRSKSPNYILCPSSQTNRGSTPVYAFCPGASSLQHQKAWPTRAHDGSTPASDLQVPSTATSRHGETSSPTQDGKFHF